MVGFAENGQGYFLFEELDIEGALKEVLVECTSLLRRIEGDCRLDAYRLRILKKRFDKLITISLYLERLKKGQKYI